VGSFTLHSVRKSLGSKILCFGGAFFLGRVRQCAGLGRKFFLASSYASGGAVLCVRCSYFAAWSRDLFVLYFFCVLFLWSFGQIRFSLS
jgi:hypothetical protein